MTRREDPTIEITIDDITPEMTREWIAARIIRCCALCGKPTIDAISHTGKGDYAGETFYYCSDRCKEIVVRRLMWFFEKVEQRVKNE